ICRKYCGADLPVCGRPPGRPSAARDEGVPRRPGGLPHKILPWLSIFTPALIIFAWQLFERLTTGAWPAAVLSGYFSHYRFQSIQPKLESALALAIHSWFIVFPLLVLPAAIAAWRKRREPETLFLLAWIAIFLAGSAVLFFAGAARYLLPMAAPVVLLTSR